MRWELSEKFHLTLKFLGDVEESKLRALSQKLQENVSSVSDFSITLSTLGAFPFIQHPKILWIGAVQHEQLQLLAATVDETASIFGIAREQRPFHAHVTLGRVKQDRRVHGLTEVLKSIMFQPIIVECNEVQVVASQLRPFGSVYSTFHSIRFKSLR